MPTHLWAARACSRTCMHTCVPIVGIPCSTGAFPLVEMVRIVRAGPGRLPARGAAVCARAHPPAGQRRAVAGRGRDAGVPAGGGGRRAGTRSGPPLAAGAVQGVPCEGGEHETVVGVCTRRSGVFPLLLLGSCMPGSRRPAWGNAEGPTLAGCDGRAQCPARRCLPRLGSLARTRHAVRFCRATGVSYSASTRRRAADQQVEQRTAVKERRCLQGCRLCLHLGWQVTALQPASSLPRCCEPFGALHMHFTLLPTRRHGI